MVKFVFLALLACRVSSEDSAVQNVLRAIEDSAAHVELPGKQKKIAINSLMRQVAGAKAPLTANQAEVVTNVTNLFAQVKQMLFDTAALDDTNQAAFVAAVADCNTENQNQLDTVDTAYSTAEGVHDACRHQEVTDLATRETHCDGHLNNWLSSRSQPFSSCFQGVLPIQDNVDEWTNAANSVLVTFSSSVTEFQPLKTNCDNALSALAATASQCDADQTTFETAVCNLRSTYDTVCSGRNTCYTNAVNGGQANFDDENARGEAMQRVARLIDYATCLCQELLNDNAANAMDNCANIMDRVLANDYADYATQDRTIPAEAPCAIPTLPEYPFQTYYDAQTNWVEDAISPPRYFVETPITCAV